MSPLPPPSEDAYDRIRLRQWSAGAARSAGIDRRDLLKLVAAASAAVPLASVAAPVRAAAAPAADGLPGVVKPLPPELFTLRGTNAQMNFAALKGTGLLTPADRFFVRNHTATPRIDRDTWKLTVWGDGLKGCRRSSVTRISCGCPR
ncbi:Sulfite oxidase OS=Streptomyces microflavus OX=1919 GN=Smic_01720 PE=4 SV=1 [Streptomyces microflavus]